MKILGLHIRNTRNVGDLGSSPLNYFKFRGHDVRIADMRTPPEDFKPSLVIYGGGSITSSEHFKRWPCPTVAWGVGHTVKRRPWDEAMEQEHVRASALCDLYFPRDRVPGFESRWAPCPSCMHPAFDDRVLPEHELVKYSAARRVDCSMGPEPHMWNTQGTIEDAIRFLASGKSIIASSYHGAYWGRLLRRKVHVIAWGSKFEYLPDMHLEQCRAANRRAYKTIMDAFNLWTQ
jgi:hypothetical protein